MACVTRASCSVICAALLSVDRDTSETALLSDARLYLRGPSLGESVSRFTGDVREVVIGELDAARRKGGIAEDPIRPLGPTPACICWGCSSSARSRPNNDTLGSVAWASDEHGPKSWPVLGGGTTS